MRSGSRHEIGREIAAVELHAVHGFQLRGHGLRFLDRDHAILADLLHRFGDHVTDGGIAVGGNPCRPERSCRRTRASRAS